MVPDSCLRFSWLSSVLPQFLLGRILIRPRSLPCKSCQIYHSPIILPSTVYIQRYQQRHQINHLIFYHQPLPHTLDPDTPLSFLFSHTHRLFFSLSVRGQVARALNILCFSRLILCEAMPNAYLISQCELPIFAVRVV